MSEAGDLAPGTVLLGKLEVVRLLGRGGMATVYEVEHSITKRRSALKLLHATHQRSDVVERFLREASAAGRIGNEHIVETLDAGTLESGEPYLVMELLQGESLAERLSRERVLPIAELADVIGQACNGVGAAHGAGIVHRDLKPDNLHLSRRRDALFVKVLDFGISKFDESKTGVSGMTQDGAFLGTPYYMAPEQIRGATDLDAGVDIYALGVILYEAATGRKPFDANTLTELAVQIHEGRAQPLASLRPDAPPGFAELVARAMHPDRRQRFATAHELAQGLQHYRSGRHSGHPPSLALAVTQAGPSAPPPPFLTGPPPPPFVTGPPPPPTFVPSHPAPASGAPRPSSLAGVPRGVRVAIAILVVGGLTKFVCNAKSPPKKPAAATTAAQASASPSLGGAPCAKAECTEGSSCIDGICALRCTTTRDCGDRAGARCMTDHLCAHSVKVVFLYTGKATDDASHDEARRALATAHPWLETDTVENVTPASASRSIGSAVERGENLVITTSPSLTPAVIANAKAHPTSPIRYLAVGDETPSLPPPIRVYHAPYHHAWYAAGYAAAMKSSHGKLGYIAAQPTAESIADVDAFALGARSAKGNATIEVRWNRDEESVVKEVLDTGAEVIASDLASDRVVAIVARASTKKSPRFAIVREAATCTAASMTCLGHASLGWSPIYEPFVKSLYRGGALDHVDLQPGKASFTLVPEAAGVAVIGSMVKMAMDLENNPKRAEAAPCTFAPGVVTNGTPPPVPPLCEPAR